MYPLFPDIMGGADMLVFVVQGVVLTAGAVSLASSLDRVWTFAVERLGRGGRGLAPRLGIAYPLARRFRTSMLLGMFSLVIFTVTILTSFSASLEGNTRRDRRRSSRPGSTSWSTPTRPTPSTRKHWPPATTWSRSPG